MAEPLESFRVGMTGRHEVVVTREALRVPPFSVQTWDAQASGTSIKPVAEGARQLLSKLN